MKGGDVDYNEWKYRNKVVAKEKLMWNLRFALCFATVLGVVSWMMEDRNTRVDSFILEVCEELAGRFEQEGYSIRYRTRVEEDGIALSHFCPERAIYFREIKDKELRDLRSNVAYTPLHRKKARRRRRRPHLAALTLWFLMNLLLDKLLMF